SATNGLSILRGYAIDGVQLTLNEGGISAPLGSNSYNAPILYGGSNPLLGMSTVGAVSLMAANNNLILKPNGTTEDGSVTISSAGTVQIRGLIGTGTQMVTVSSSG